MNQNTIYHFVGIKGSGMSALATILHDRGLTVQGSDVAKYFFTQKRLEDNGIKILEFNEANISEGMTIIAGNAFSDDHPELVRASELGLNIIRYHDFMSEIMTESTSIAITGSHGKTSTTGLMAHVLRNIKPTSYLIGDGTGRGEVDADYFVFEACEYRRHFLSYTPDYAVITNIDFDHPDYYTSIEDVQEAFTSFASGVKKAIFACGDDQRLLNMASSVPIIFYGMGEHNDFRAENIERTTEGSSFDVYIRGEYYAHFDIPTFGQHNIQNALSVIAVAHYEGLEREHVAKHLRSFAGVKRRFSEKIFENTIVIDDYAHHPAEIRATLDAARQKYPNKEIIAVFQPHTFTRTIALLTEFAEALDLADSVYLCNIFNSAREASGDITIEDLLTKTDKGRSVLHEDDVSPLLDHRDGVIVFMGAGDVDKFEFAFEKLLASTQRSQL